MLFDAPFFSMTALEATGTDPQQRLMLEVAYEALENGKKHFHEKVHWLRGSFEAGIPIQNIVGTKTGVYVGCFTNDFESVGGRDPCKYCLHATHSNLCNNNIFHKLEAHSMPRLATAPGTSSLRVTKVYCSTDHTRSMLSNRISWFFDLRGPSFTVDTACSSSLYAV